MVGDISQIKIQVFYSFKGKKFSLLAFLFDIISKIEHEYVRFLLLLVFVTLKVKIGLKMTNLNSISMKE